MAGVLQRDLAKRAAHVSTYSLDTTTIVNQPTHPYKPTGQAPLRHQARGRLGRELLLAAVGVAALQGVVAGGEAQKLFFVLLVWRVVGVCCGLAFGGGLARLSSLFVQF